MDTYWALWTKGLPVQNRKISRGSCRLCLEDDETPIHFLRDCPAVSKTRQLCLGKHIMCNADIKQTDPKKILLFFNRLDLEGF